MKKRPYLRAYVNGEMFPSLERKIWKSPINTAGNFQSWFNDIFECRKSGLILNGAERWALRACAKFAAWIRPKIYEEDPLHLGIEAVIFAGDYGFTPFGVHYDEPCASVIHFNLGPCPKDIFIFEKDALLGIPRSLQDATRYTIEPGDGFVLPANYAHIGDAPEFSIDISFKLTFRSTDEIISHTIGLLIDQGNKDLGTTLSDVILHRLGAENSNELVGVTVENILTNARHRSWSNMLFSGSPIKESAHWSDNSIISLANEFPLVTHVHNNVIYIYSRGYSHRVVNHGKVRSALESLNQNRHMSVLELRKQCESYCDYKTLIDFIVTSRGVIVSN
ncbi:hypothetical protein QWZ03_17115 [Chitinimonas viridis]|uniref:JmjC domain-containing protein n=1 Tax=Chitinimonas viridis TaxID=664880 RepID=A0ABT8B8N9_9NEIS|nr:hypothetical protein [Chitinimonas viridis]MDN3578493.1 hypothetical protein [Chitinimonas viridis]